MSLTIYPAEGFDSLVSLDDCNAYQASMGNTWSGADSAKEVALRRATRHLLSRYRPAAWALDPVHANVKAACCELAWRALAGPLEDDIDPQAVIEETVGPITTRYASPSNGGRKRYAVVDDLLAGLTAGGSQISVIRA